MLVALYLFAIVAANLLVAQFGPSISILNAFLFIGLDITARDSLHERWKGRHLWLKMALLIASGSALSALLNANAAPIAIASTAAFALSGLFDVLTYTALGEQSRFVRVNGSNTVSSTVDSLVFPILAFGFPPLWGVIAGQIAAKWLGGVVWYLVLSKVVPKK